jgi:ureidoglycolate lyase
MTSRILNIEPLTPEAFAPFGEVISPEAAQIVYAVNDGTSQRFHALGHVECIGGTPVISIFRAQPRELPFEIRMLERHPLGSQAFVPLSDAPYLVVVAGSPTSVPRAFLAQKHGVNFRSGVWHHPLLALRGMSDFLVVDRTGRDENCEEAPIGVPWVVDSIQGLDSN